MSIESIDNLPFERIQALSVALGANQLLIQNHLNVMVLGPRRFRIDTHACMQRKRCFIIIIIFKRNNFISAVRTIQLIFRFFLSVFQVSEAIFDCHAFNM